MGLARDELSHWLRLTLTPGVGDTVARKLLAAFGLPEALFAQSRAALRHLVSEAQAAALTQVPEGLDALVAQTWDWLQADADHPTIGRRLVTLGDPDYPPALLEIADPPLMLYVMGARRFGLAQWSSRSLAIVGSRNPTPQGAANARSFGRALAEAGVCVVSGMALGVDGAAHQGALEGAADDGDAPATVAVVGTGLDRVYPARHRALAHRIAQHGLLVSEFPLGTPPLTQNFPMRNRLIAGLSRGTLVVEAALQSGSLITARLAVEQGKDVFAIPGSIHAPQARGCHLLIRQGAKLVETVHDIFEDLDLRTDTRAAAPPADTTAAEPAPEDALLSALGHDPVSLDALVARTGWPPATLQARLLELEIAEAVARLPGGLFQRIARG